ncbi:uncharacterized protein LOC141668872 isoform X2 [Apium graveolens]|uniref:uncharacterized protein LOC141668872 isoform X2 n=1 Tax=Apium graveolens TaxID=4045 RepID=UPI003D7BDC49
MEEADPSQLLFHLESILDSDPLINEVGFIHPSQFLALAEEASTLVSASLETVAQPEDERVNKKLLEGNTPDMVFWNRDHKLGISTEFLLPLYKAAKYAFMAAVGQYNNAKLSGFHEESGDASVSGRSSSFQNFCAIDVMKHSRALLLLSSDFGTAWNYRKLMVSKEPHVANLMDELGFSKLVLSYSPKSECAWSHRRWVIKMISGKCLNLQEIVGKESDLVKLIAEKSKMNYRAWNHRCWLVSYMSSGQVIYEIISSRDWAGLNVADNSCFHYRSRLMLRMFKGSQTKQGPKTISSHDAEYFKIYKEELDWNEMLIKRYTGREALWLYRRFLALYWINQFVADVADALPHSNLTPISTSEIKTFLDNELQLFYSCQVFSINDFDDYRAQATFSSTYMLWITRHFSKYPGIEPILELRPRDLREVLEKNCPERSCLWNSFRTP